MVKTGYNMVRAKVRKMAAERVGRRRRRRVSGIVGLDLGLGLSLRSCSSGFGEG